MATEDDADAAARELSGLLRTVAAAVPLEPVAGMEGKREGDLVGECPFHVITSLSREGRHLRRRERTLYVRFAERQWRCARCLAGGDSAEFAYRIDLEDRIVGLSPTGLAIKYHGGPNDGRTEELDPERPGATVTKEIPVRDPHKHTAVKDVLSAILEDKQTIIGIYTFGRREGDILHYLWRETPASRKKG